MNENRVSLQVIYDEVIQHYSWENYAQLSGKVLTSLLRVRSSSLRRLWSARLSSGTAL